jgi:PhoPQ-activated pathogenicity-related protein
MSSLALLSSQYLMPLVPPLIPLRQAVVRAMDATTEFITKTHNAAVQKFIVAGASKRGWTTWTTGAVDSRVIAIIPIVMGELD